MKETGVIGFACLLGGFIGALFALGISQSFELGKYFWAFGVLVGGSVAYFAYDFNAVRGGAKRAWKNTIQWKPDEEWWKAYLTTLVIVPISMSIISATCVFYLLSGIMFFDIRTTIPVSNAILINKLMMAGMLAFIISPIITLPLGISENTTRLSKFSFHVARLLKYINPISLPFWVAYYSIKGLTFIVVKIPAGVSLFWEFIWKFVKTAFVYIHSDERTICFVDASIGASIGYFLGNPIIGGIVGCLFGVINYEIVSKRLLDLNTPG